MHTFQQIAIVVMLIESCLSILVSFVVKDESNKYLLLALLCMVDALVLKAFL